MHKVAKNVSHPMFTFPFEVKQGNNLPYFSSHAVNKHLFTVCFHIVLDFAFFCDSCSYFCCLKQPSSTGPKCSLMFLSVRRLRGDLLRKCVLHELVRTGVMSSMLVNQQYILDKMSFNRNIHKTKYKY